jgi:threonine dehydratase
MSSILARSIRYNSARMDTQSTLEPWSKFDSIRIGDAAARVKGVVKRTPLAPFDSSAADDAARSSATRDSDTAHGTTDALHRRDGGARRELVATRIELRMKLENRQETGSFKARGAWNQISQLSDRERRAGVICTSSGNHGKALAWAAERAGVPATIVMPENAYANKIQACRDHGAEVVLGKTRELAEAECARRVERGVTLVHPYDAARTIEGAGTVGLEIAEDWPDVDVVIVPVGGGGLISGTSLALRRVLGKRVKIFGAEPRGAPSLTRGIAEGKPVMLEKITSKVQGLTPLYSGQINVDVCTTTLDGIILVDDEDIFAAQKRLVAAGEVVEPGGSAAAAVVFASLLPKDLFANLGVKQRLKVAVVVSGGNPDPAQLESVRAEIAREQGDAKPSGDRFASKHDRSDSSHDRSDSGRDRSDSGRDRSGNP